MSNQFIISNERAIELLSTIDILCQPITLERITEGSESQVWLVNSDYVLRIHTNANSDEEFTREIGLLELLRATSLSEIILPCIWSKYLLDRGWHCALYAKAKGWSVEEVPELLSEVTEAGLVDLLYGLRTVNVESVRALGIRDLQPLELTNLQREAVKAWMVIHDDVVLKDLSTLDINHLLGPYHDYVNTPSVLLHADLKGEHIFVGSDGSLTGVIDWTDACVGPPSVDIAGIAISVGATTAARVALGAGYCRNVVAEGIFFARCNTVVLLAERLSGTDDSPIDLLRTQLRRAFEEYQ